MHKLNINWQIRIFFAIFMVVLVVFAKSPFNFLILNTFLGYIPIELGFHLTKFSSTKSLLFWIIFIFWILFYPNAPYILTDLFHLSLLNPHIGSTGLLKSDPKMWFYFSMLIISALSCALISFTQLKQLGDKFSMTVLKKIPFASEIFITLMCILSSIGIYMGRFLRIHSFYILLTPTWFFKQIMSMWSTRMLEFTLILTIIQLVIIWIMNIAVKLNQPQNPSA
ncbi:DUF1361 domain-containing protein [Paucilactobacillus suebicus]|uniref:Uncharacterized protein n=1 Tax=Paucilactobacillus suebicus DSM 5007 = KCTC 3549 TaxID=1423807 RepID=A0A0R1WD35_9LACO|nr:DUF1361 domain-containing protein [Paucilactobacillus suebicus]KRM13561.1 hypothetical protein FD16_GL000130 [Paucilactobacillus suebicus DSM 5007 = KCTC 3549]